MKNPFKLLLILTALALPMAGLADEEEYVMSKKSPLDNISPGTRLTVDLDTKFAFGSFWDGGNSLSTTTDSNGTLIFQSALFWGEFGLISPAAIGDNTLTMKVGSETLTCDIYFDASTLEYAMSEKAPLDNVSPLSRIAADGGTQFTFATYWAGEGDSVSVVADGSQIVFSRSGAGFGTFTLPISTMSAGNHTLVIMVGGTAPVTHTCDIALTLDYPYEYAAKSNLDNKTPHTTILLQSEDVMAYCLHWGSKDAVSVAVLADGLAGTITEGLSNINVYDSTETGWFNTFSWDYSEKPVETLPRGPYTLSHCTFDGNGLPLDTTKCSVKLLPEPMAITGLIWLLALLGSARKRG